MPNICQEVGQLDESLILQLFELGKLFVDKKMVTFRAQGICMYPCIQEGDILHVESKSLPQITAGDIVVYRSNNRLFSHRAIGKAHDDTEYCITNPDTARYAVGEKIADKDILGIVSQIERRGKLLDPQRRAHPLLLECIYALCFRGLCLRQYLYIKAVSIVRYLQRFTGYQKIAKIMFSPVLKRISFSVQVPLNDTTGWRLPRVIASQELASLKEEITQRHVLKLRIIARIGTETAACLEYASTSQPALSSRQWLPTLRTRIRYRHTGIEEKLYNYADRIFREIYQDR